jgi:hypothetical protein
MRKSKSLTIAAAAIGVGLGIPTFADAQSTNAIGLADKEGVFIDGKSFSILPGRTPEELAGLLRMLDARSLGQGAIVFRSDDKLYIATAPVAVERSGGSRNDYASDRYGPPIDPQAERDWRAWQESLRLGYNSARYGGSRNDYGSDRNGRDSGASASQVERDWREWQDSLKRGDSTNRDGGRPQ